MANQTAFQDKITCGSWTFNDNSALPLDLRRLGVNILDGWDDTPTADVIVTSGGTRDGDIAAPRFPVRARTVQLGGWLYTPSRASSIRARTALARDAFPRNTVLRLTRYEPDATKYLNVQRTSIECPWQTNSVPTAFRFLVSMVAVDPFKYSSTVDLTGVAGVVGISSGGFTYPQHFPATLTGVQGDTQLISVVNQGSASAYPVVTIHGPLPIGWRWTNVTTGGSIQFGITVSAGDELVIDHKLQTAALNGQDISASIAGDWWLLAPGLNVLKLFGEYDPNANVSLSARSTWE
jgi:hypothetical protein